MKKSIFLLSLVPSILVFAACTTEEVASPTLSTSPTPTLTPAASPTQTLVPVPTATPTLTLYAKFTTRANGICNEANEQVGALGSLTEEQVSQVEAAGAYQEIADYLDSLISIQATALDRLRILPPPKEEAEIFGEFLSALKELLEIERSAAATLRAENLAGFEESVQRGHAIESDLSSLAGQAGIRQCNLTGIP